VSLPAAVLPALGTAVVVGEARGADLEVTPGLTVEETYTDNVRGVATGAEGDFITSATASVDARSNGARVQFSTNASLAYDDYLETDLADGWRVDLLGAATAEVVEDNFFVDLRAAVSQEALSRTVTQDLTVFDRQQAITDQTRVVSYAITPRYVNRFGTFADLDVSYTFAQVRFDESDVGDAGEAGRPEGTTQQTARATLVSGDRFTRLPWVATVEDDRSDTTDRTTVEASGEYVWNRHLGLLFGAGRDWIDGDGLSQDLDGVFWNLGVRLTPGPRTNLRASYGRRYGGETFDASLQYRVTESLTFTATYDVALQTVQETFTDALQDVVIDEEGNLVGDTTGLPADPNDRPFDATTETTSVNRTLTLGFGGTIGQNSYTLSGTWTERDFERAGTGPASSNSSNLSVSAGYSRQISPEGTVGGTLRHARSATEGGDATSVSGADLFATHEIDDVGIASIRYAIVFGGGGGGGGGALGTGTLGTGVVGTGAVGTATGTTADDDRIEHRFDAALTRALFEDASGSLTYTYRRRGGDDAGAIVENQVSARFAITF